MKRLFYRLVNAFKTAIYLWDKPLLAFLTNDKEHGFMFTTLFEIDTQEHAEDVAKKLEWFAKEVRSGRYTKIKI